MTVRRPHPDSMSAKKRAQQSQEPTETHNAVGRLRRELAECFYDQIVDGAKAKLALMFAGVDKLTDPAEQVVAFFRAVSEGMPPKEAGRFFLFLDPEEWAQFIEANPETRALITNFEGRIAQEQYRKVTREGSPKEALEWLRTHRPEVWRERSELQVEDVTDDPERAAKRLARIRDELAAQRDRAVAGSEAKAS